MIRDDRELLAELARVNTDVVPLALRVMDDSATAEEQQQMAGRLIDLGQRLRQRAGRPRRCLVLPLMSWYLEQPCTVVSNRHS